MSSGLLIKNNNSEFLISTEMRNLHHYYTHTTPSISVITNNFGGLTKFSYGVTLPVGFIPVPFFTTPFTDRYYAIERISETAHPTDSNKSNWLIELISSGGYPTTTDNGTNPSGGQLTQATDGPYYSRVGPGISTSLTDKYFVIETPGSTASNFTGNGKITAVWNGTKVLDNVNLPISNGVPSLFDGGGTSSSDDNLYFARKSSTDAVPTSITDDPTATYTSGTSKFYFFRITQQYYYTTSGSSGSLPSGSYGTEQIPKLIIFADARAVVYLPEAQQAYGLYIRNSLDQSAAFDSRKNPLVIKQITTVSHPTTAASNFSGSGLSARNASGPISTWSSQATPNLFNSITVNTMPTNQMFHYSTVTQRHQQVSRVEAEEECDGAEVKGNCVGSKRIYYWRSTYWNYYRGGIRRANNTTIYAGYINKEYGFYHSRTTDSAFFGVSTGSSGGSSTGKWPWDSSQINAAGTGVNTLIIADSTNYI